MKTRRQKRGLPDVAASAELPLFREGAESSPVRIRAARSPVRREPVVDARGVACAVPPRLEEGPTEASSSGRAAAEPAPSPPEARREIPRGHEEVALDLPFRVDASEDQSLAADVVLDAERGPERGPEPAPVGPEEAELADLDRELVDATFLSRRVSIVEDVSPVEDEAAVENGADEYESDEDGGEVDALWDDALAAGPSPGPVSRPARAAERMEAAAVDLALMGGLAITVIYFSSRVAQVPLDGLVPAAPWIGAWVLGVSLAYATFFTGTTGQTLGKIAVGLRVIDTGNRPPTYGRALLRALTGIAGVGFMGAGLLPLLFDPARRALHDRLCHTRVIRG